MKNDSLSPTELKTMTCGLSSILDLDSNEIESSQKHLFTEEAWESIFTKYNSCKWKLPPFPNKLKQVWDTIINICSNENDSSNAKKFLYKMKLNESTSKDQDGWYSLFEEIISIIDSQ